MTTDEFLKQPLSLAAADPGVVQGHIDSTVANLAMLRQLLTIAKAGAKPGRKRAPKSRERKTPASAPAANHQEA